MRKIVTLIITFILSMALYTPVFADIAPPEPPPGSGINPSQETRVQMVAENVLMVVMKTTTDKYIIEVTADFAMKNLGNTDEQLQVRFPLENITGRGDGRGNHPEIRNFKASVNNSKVPTKTIQEPYQNNDIPLNWAVFDVNFPAGQYVSIRISYITDVQDDESAFIQYILGTGAGWYQSIGTATITLRFPYAVSMANVIWLHEPEELHGNVVLIGKEIRWQWKNYEPAADEIIGVSVVHPKDWQNILNLEYKTGIDPNDIDLAIELSRAYQNAGLERGYFASDRLRNLAVTAIDQALALHPNEIRLHLELAELYYKGYWLSSYETENPYTQKLMDELVVLLEIDPTNQRALELKTILEKDLANVQSITPSATQTKKVIVKTPTTRPSETPTQKSSETPPPTVIPTGMPKLDTERSSGIQVFAGIFVLIVGFIAGAIFTMKREKSP